MPTLPQYNTRALPQYVSRSQPGGAVRGGPSSSVDVSVLVRGVSSAADTFERARRVEQEQQERTQAAEVLSTAQLDWTKNELERRNTYDPASGKPYAEAVQRDFDDYSAKTLNGVRGDGARQLVRDRLLAMRTRLVGNAMEFEVGARADYRKRALGSTLDKRVATASIDPSQAVELMAQQTAEVNHSAELSPPEREVMNERTRGEIAVAALTTLAGRDPAAVRESPLLGMVPAKNLPGLLKMAEKSDELARSQAAADQIMGAGVPLDEAMKHIEANFDGEQERAVKAEVLGRYSYAEAARRDREQEVYGTAQLEVEQGGRVTPATWASLTDGHRAAILNRQQAEARQRRIEAEGRPVKTDFALYTDLRQMAINEPAKFKATDLRQYVDRIGGPQLEQLLDLKTKTEEPGARAEVATISQQLGTVVDQMKLGGTGNAEKRGAFEAGVYSALDVEQRNKGKPLTFAERQAVIDRQTLEMTVPGFFYDSTKRAFELSPAERAKAEVVVPDLDRQQITEALRAAKRPITDAAIRDLFLRKKGL